MVKKYDKINKKGTTQVEKKKRPKNPTKHRLVIIFL